MTDITITCGPLSIPAAMLKMESDNDVKLNYVAPSGQPILYLGHIDPATGESVGDRDKLPCVTIGEGDDAVHHLIDPDEIKVKYDAERVGLFTVYDTVPFADLAHERLVDCYYVAAQKTAPSPLLAELYTALAKSKLAARLRIAFSKTGLIFEAVMYARNGMLIIRKWIVDADWTRVTQASIYTNPRTPGTHAKQIVEWLQNKTLIDPTAPIPVPRRVYNSEFKASVVGEMPALGDGADLARKMLADITA